VFETDRIDSLLELAASSGAVPGVVVFVVGRNGILYEGAAGRLSVNGGTPAGADTMIRIASMTKAMTSVAALQLVEQGKLQLDQTVASVLPAFAEKQVLTGFDGDTPKLRPPARQATIRQLMNQTAGLGYWFYNTDLARYHQVTGVPNTMSGLRSALDAPLIDDPGARWEYGINTDWLGQVIEAVSGKGLDAYFADHIFAPLGITDGTFSPSPEQRERLMAVHTRTPDGGLVAIPLEFPPAPEYWTGGHGVVCTARDYARFLGALLDGGGGILRPESVDLMLTDSIGGLPLPEVMRSADPTLSNDIPSLPVRQGWSLGLHLFLEDLEGMRRAGSGDCPGLLNCYFWIDRESGLAGGLLTQVLPFFDAQVVQLLVAVEQALYAQLPKPAAAL
jgi:CubicO group peptidase (beta-lactamase class C family)